MALSVFFQEIKSLLRDRHIFLYSILVPALLYPCVLLGILQVMTYVRGVEERLPARVLVQDEHSGGRLQSILVSGVDDEGGDAGETGDDGEAADENAAQDERPAVIVLDAPATPIDRDEAASLLRGEELPEGAERCDAIVVTRPSPSTPPSGFGGPRGLVVEVYYSQARDASIRARQRVHEGIDRLRQELLQVEARAAGGTEELISPLEVEETSLSSDKELANHLAGLVLPLLMIFMMALGAFYPALDCAVGEKERGTLETTLILPVTRWTLVTGKYLAVICVAVCSFLLNLGGMYLAFQQLPHQLRGGFQLSLPLAGLILLAAVLLAAFFSAVMMMLAFLARSFKEGQSYVTPVYLLSLAPIVVTTHPDLHLTPGLACVPLVNTALLFRDALEDRVEPLPACIALASSALLAGLAIFAASRILGRESIVTGSGPELGKYLKQMFSKRSREEAS